MEQLAHFVSKAFEPDQNSVEVEERGTEEDRKRTASPVTIDLSQRNISPPKAQSERVSSPKSEAEKKENLRNVVDGLTNSQRNRIMENIYQKLDFRNAKMPPPEDGPRFGCADGDAKKPRPAKTNAMDIVNLIGEQKKSESVFASSRERLSEERVNGLAETKSAESPSSVGYARIGKDGERGSSESPIIDPEDSTSSAGSVSAGKDKQDTLKGRIFSRIDNESKTGYYLA
ncbi:UNVERIFIED_CONTAM: hypothetical protein PYX00_000913 [Menopon gallinae]|uniref:Uncharacterized protein n=1 Tax=Menopon gallinae TaxID=328185 RepID=A0AAW2IBP0_9NEOP